MQKLRWLLLSGNAITDTGMEQLGNHVNLETLLLKGTDVGDSGMSTLRAMTKLSKFIC